MAHNNAASIYETDYTDYQDLVEQSQDWIEARAKYIIDNLTVYDDEVDSDEVPDDNTDEDGETNMIEISCGEIKKSTHEQIYDVYGRRVIAPKKGTIYIINGKKVIF